MLLLDLSIGVGSERPLVTTELISCLEYWCIEPFVHPGNRHTSSCRAILGDHLGQADYR